MERASGDPRLAFEQAADFYLATVDRIRPDQWDQPGLGVWSVRDLVGHTSRAFLTVETYLDLLARAQGARQQLPAVLGELDCLITAAAPGEAPKGWHALGEKFDQMGDTSQSRAWTLLHVPQVTVPCHRGPAGLPIGIQLIARYGPDRSLLHMARWAEDVLAESPVKAVA